MGQAGRQAGIPTNFKWIRCIFLQRRWRRNWIGSVPHSDSVGDIKRVGDLSFSRPVLARERRVVVTITTMWLRNVNYARASSIWIMSGLCCPEGATTPTRSEAEAPLIEALNNGQPNPPAY